MSFCGWKEKKTSTVASHILIRSVSRVYENTYLLMCLFLLAVRNTPDKQNLFGLSGSAGGVWSGCCVPCFFTHHLVDFLFFWFRLFMIEDGKLLFLCLFLWMLMLKGVSDVLPSSLPRHHPGLIPLCFVSGSILWMFSAWWGPWALLNIF